MNGSWVHLLHLVAFGLVAATLVPGFVLNRKLIAEKDPARKLAIGGIMKTFGAFVPYNVALLLLTGIGNIYNRFLGVPYPWYEEGWLVVKLCLFAVIAFNALFVTPALSKSRMMIIRQMAEGKSGGEFAGRLGQYDRKATLLLIVQAALLLTILGLSVFGPGKHPGVF